jgi:hypothetical protein
MLCQLALAGLVLAAPSPRISYEKKVMVDPSYRSHMSQEQIARALEPPPPRPRPQVQETVVVERVVEQPGHAWWLDLAAVALWTVPWFVCGCD